MNKTQRFNQSGLIVERHTTREGPSPYFVAYYKNTSMGFFTEIEMLRWLKLPGGPTRASLEQWLDDLTQGVEPQAPPLDVERVKAEGFGPEAHDDGPTKMIT